MITPLFLLLPALLSISAPKKSPVQQAMREIDGVTVQYAVIDLSVSNISVEPLLAKNGIGTQEPLLSMARRTAPSVAITGAFFDTKSLQPLGDLVQNGTLIHFGGRGAALCIGPKNAGFSAEIRSNAG
jgi:hypothetical protein